MRLIDAALIEGVKEEGLVALADAVIERDDGWVLYAGPQCLLSDWWERIPLGGRWFYTAYCLWPEHNPMMGLTR